MSYCVGTRRANSLAAAIIIVSVSVKDVQGIQGIFGHSKADTTVNVYMPQIDDSVKQTLDAIYSELMARPKLMRYREIEEFGTLWYGGFWGGPQVIVLQGPGA